MTQLVIARSPSLCQCQEWERIYDETSHGRSYLNMFRKLKYRRNTILMIQDENDDVFGGFCPVEWKIKR